MGSQLVFYILFAAIKGGFLKYFSAHFSTSSFFVFTKPVFVSSL